MTRFLVLVLISRTLYVTPVDDTEFVYSINMNGGDITLLTDASAIDDLKDFFIDESGI